MNQNGIKFIPYTEVDGIRNFPDSYLKCLFERMQTEKLIGKVFYDGNVQTAEDFLDMMKYGQNKLFMIFMGNELAGIVWLNNFQRRSANIHFCLFKNAWGKESVSIGKAILKEFLYMKDSQGYVFDVLIGETPANNRLAVKWIHESGMTVVGEIPNATWDYTIEKSIPSVISYAVRKKEV